MMRITKQINRLMDEYQTVFLVQLPLTGSVVAYAQNPRDVDYLYAFWTPISDREVFSTLKMLYEYHSMGGDGEMAAKYKNAISKLKEQEGII